MVSFFPKIAVLLVFSFVTSLSYAQNYQPTQPAYKWYRAGEQTVLDSKALFPSQKKAKNVILFVGDGMGVTTVTAARILAGQQQKKSGEETVLSFEKFPFLALSKTYNTDQQVSDSAGAITAMITGVKTRAGVLSVDETVKRGAVSSLKGHTLTTLIEEAEDWGLATGIVTTTRITHATPAASYAHISDRTWESDAQLPAAAKKAGVADIALQFLQFSRGDGINLVLGGGRDSFLPQKDGGQRLDGRNLIAEWNKKYPKGVVVSDNKSLDQIDWKNTDHVLGLFSPSHMSYNGDRKDGPEGEPSLTKMTEKAIAFLSRYPQGYVLVVEGGRIDHAHHEGNAQRALTEAIELAQAVGRATQMTNNQETLIIVTADHSHALAMNGSPPRGHPILTEATLSYVPSLTHGGEDVPVYARGPGSAWIHGVMEQNMIYHVMRQALGK